MSSNGSGYAVCAQGGYALRTVPWDSQHAIRLVAGMATGNNQKHAHS